MYWRETAKGTFWFIGVFTSLSFVGTLAIANACLILGLRRHLNAQPCIS